MSTEYEEARTVKDDANDAYNAVRAICHHLPVNSSGPTVYDLTGNLKLAAGYIMRDALAGMVSGLSRSLIDLDYYMDDKSDPSVAVAKANVHLEKAAALAAQLGDELSAAQSAVARLGYREPGDPGYRKPEDRR